MKILAHRGFWKNEDEKNSMTALMRAVECGYGFETDLRDFAGKLVISHNPPRGDEITAEEVFKMYHKFGCNMPLALDIKADGLQDMMKDLLIKYNIMNYFVVDMSVCDTIAYIKKDITIASRISEYEPTIPFYKESKVVWIDYFDGRADVTDVIRKCLKHGKVACVVSPELHHLPHDNMWKILKNITGEYYLCTDYPQEAEIFFNK